MLRMPNACEYLYRTNRCQYRPIGRHIRQGRAHAPSSFADGRPQYLYGLAAPIPVDGAEGIVSA